MILTIVLRKEVEDTEAAQKLFDLIKKMVTPQHDFKITGSFQSQLLNGEPEPPPA